MRWTSRSATRGPAIVSDADLARAARVLRIRSDRQAAGLFAGSYASAFRGGGIEFEESRPYAPGDDVHALDWNASARTGEPYVKHFREERNQTLIFALDVSGSMRFGTTGRSKATLAAHALALLQAAAARAGDRTGLVAFGDGTTAQIAPGRGGAHGHRVLRSALSASRAAAGPTRLEDALRALRVMTRRRAIVCLLSDFRDSALLPAPPHRPRLRAALAELARRHDVIALPVVDPAEEHLPDVGPLRIADPEAPGAVRLVHTSRARERRRYEAAARAWRERLERELRRSGVEVVPLRTDRSPLRILARFFRERAARRVAA